VRDLWVGQGTVAASASHHGSASTTRVSHAPAGWKLTIGPVLPAGADIASVTLDGAVVTPTVRDTTRGREVTVATRTGSPHTLVVTSA
jgi:hypothetical protein